MRALAFAVLLASCGPSQSVKERAADGAYLAEHMRCVQALRHEGRDRRLPRGGPPSVGHRHHVA